MVQDVAHPVNFALEGFDADCLGLVGKRHSGARRMGTPGPDARPSFPLSP